MKKEEFFKKFADDQNSLYDFFHSKWDPEDTIGIGVSGRFDENQRHAYEFHIINSPFDEDFITREDSKEKISKFIQDRIDNKKERCLDFACGNARVLVKLRHLFKQLDGCDLRKEHLGMAKKYIDYVCPSEKEKFNFYKSSGYGSKLEGVPNNYYDLIYSTIAMIHIIPYTVRNNIFNDHYHLLKKGGRMCHQFMYIDPEDDNYSYHSDKRSWTFDEPVSKKLAIYIFLKKTFQ